MSTGDESEHLDALPANKSASGDASAAGDSTAPADSSEKTPAVAIPRMGVPTLGGMQFWGDVQFLRGWKIQRNVFSGHYRLLNPSAMRFASGTLADCQNTLKAISRVQQLEPDSGKAVILLHGIGRSSRSFSGMAAALRQAGYVVVPFEYPSTRVSMEQSAEYLHSVIQSMTHVQSIDFVVHSMGGLIVRTYLSTCQPDDRIRRMVMLGTPNRGAQLADILKSNLLFRLVYGPAGRQLVTDETGPVQSLPAPAFPFGIIAGGKGQETGYNRLLPGDNDGTVTIASARLPGAADFLRVPRLHSFLMNDPAVIAATLSFLEHSRFDLTRPPAPIPAPEE